MLLKRKTIDSTNERFALKKSTMASIIKQSPMYRHRKILRNTHSDNRGHIKYFGHRNKKLRKRKLR